LKTLRHEAADEIERLRERRLIAMDFEQELQELTDAAREAGVSLVDIIAALNAHVVTLTGEGALEEEAEHAEEEDGDT
jgi:cell division protein ZapA (FtsZ GTPase activity inhibitor)